jgi:hypothetical protein
MTTQSSFATRSHHTSSHSSARLPVAILLALCFLNFTTVLLRDDTPAYAELIQYAE